MTDEASMLAAVLADQDDDTVRLAYADWLLENGRPAQAEFISLQIEDARDARRPYGNPYDVYTAHFACCARKKGRKVRAFEREGLCGLCKMLRENAEWDRRQSKRHIRIVQLWPAVAKAYRLPWTVDRDDNLGWCNRGFINYIACGWSAWKQHSAEVLERHPVERVSFWEWLPRNSAGYIELELPDGRTFRNDDPDTRVAHIAVCEAAWPNIEFQFSFITPERMVPMLTREDWQRLDEDILRTARDQLRRWNDITAPRGILGGSS